jgi:hypothetical protein
MKYVDDTGNIVSQFKAKDFEELNELQLMRMCFLDLLEKLDYEKDEINAVIRNYEGV